MLTGLEGLDGTGVRLPIWPIAECCPQMLTSGVTCQCHRNDRLQRQPPWRYRIDHPRPREHPAARMIAGAAAPGSRWPLDPSPSGSSSSGLIGRELGRADRRGVDTPGDDPGVAQAAASSAIGVRQAVQGMSTSTWVGLTPQDNTRSPRPMEIPPAVLTALSWATESASIDRRARRRAVSEARESRRASRPPLGYDRTTKHRAGRRRGRRCNAPDWCARNRSYPGRSAQDNG